MGLTIHYQLQSDTRSAKEARQLVEQLRQRALDLPMKEVGDLVDLAGDACDFETYDRDHPLRWLAIQAGQLVEREGIHFSVTARHVIAFSCDPGEGCEQANVGLAVYPGVVNITDPRTGRARRLRTGLKGWCWRSFCKTQYASQHGGEHFLRCHLSVIRMLDHARELGILAEVNDEGGFWERRDIKSLVEQVGQWNQGMAALVGQLKDMFGGDIEAPITKFPDFERLEAKGRKKHE